MKKTFNSLILLAAASGIAFMLIGCGKGNDTSNNVAQACATGYYFYNNSCVPIGNNGVPTAPGFLYSNGFYADNYSGTSALKVTNVVKMEEFFKQGMGVCNRAGGSNKGSANCSAYSSGYTDIIIQFPNIQTNTLLATFIAQPRQNSWFNYGAQLPSGYGLLGLALGWTTGIYLPDPKAHYGAMKNPLQLEMQVSTINKSAGFQAQGYGDFWTGYNRTLLSIQVPQGKTTDNSFNFNFMVQGQTAASGTMTRCRYTNCNLY